jgi:hypothetical protein
VTYTGAATAPTNAGSYTVVATINHPNYQGSATATLVVAKIGQTITFGTLANRAFSATAFTLTATSSSGLAITYTATGQCTVTANRVTMTARGTCNITANQAGNGNFNPATPVAQSFLIQ